MSATGAFGFNDDGLHWTNVLVLPTGTDIRSAYDSQLNPLNAANADTVIVPDYPIPGRCTPFVVVLVQRGGRSGAADVLTCYLDRCQPAVTCPDPTLVRTTCCGNLLPATLHITLTISGGCGCLAGTFPVTWNGTGWAYSGTACGGKPFSMLVVCTGTSVLDWQLTLTCGSDTLTASVGGGSCSPLDVKFHQILLTSCCTGGVFAELTP